MSSLLTSKTSLFFILHCILCGLLLHLLVLSTVHTTFALEVMENSDTSEFNESYQPDGIKQQELALGISGKGSLCWMVLYEGLELLEAKINKTAQQNGYKIDIVQDESDTHNDLIILRVNPSLYEFTLHMASEDGVHRSLQEHAKANDLYAAINAGMYLPDNLTSTGFMQNATHTNNPRIASRYGAFFLAEPGQDGLPEAALREKEELGQDIAASIRDYNIIVQNFRLFDSGMKVLWPENSTAHSISALAEDLQGNILLVLCRFPLSPAEFSRLLIEMPLNCRLAMYLEGGGPAGLLVKMPEPGFAGSEKIWRGKHNSFLAFEGSYDSPLPNVIGLRPRQ